MVEDARVDVVLVAGGRWHDIDFARLEILSELDRHDVARTRVREDFSDLDAIGSSQVLITYTSDVRPSREQSDALADWLSSGGRWLALHATCSAVDPVNLARPRLFATPRVMDEFVELLGGQFLAHPEIHPHTIEVTDSGHPLLAGLVDFETIDELYVCEMHGPVEVLLHTTFTGGCPGFVEGQAVTGLRQPVLWRKATGAGMVTYFTLGHCRGRWDVADLGIADTGVNDRVAWASPGYRDVLARTIAWAVRGDDSFVHSASLTALTGLDRERRS